MSVSDGNAASASVFNGAFVSKLTDSASIGKLTLSRPDSGAQVDDVQNAINDHKARITQNETNISTNAAAIASNAAVVNTLQSSIRYSTYSETTDPTVGDDNTDGFSVGSYWVNTVKGSIWVAVDVTTGAAIWKRIEKVRLAVSSFLFLDMSTSNVTDAGYVELIADTGANTIKRIQSFYPAGSLAYIAVGAASSEVNEFILTPGGNGETGIDVDIPANSRLSIKLLSGQDIVTSGVLTMNLFTEV